MSKKLQHQKDLLAEIKHDERVQELEQLKNNPNLTI